MAKFMGTTVQVALSVTTARNPQPLASGKYEVSATTAWFLQQGGSGVVASLTTSAPVSIGERKIVDVGGVGEDYIAGILASSTATMSIVPVN